MDLLLVGAAFTAGLGGFFGVMGLHQAISRTARVARVRASEGRGNVGAAATRPRPRLLDRLGLGNEETEMELIRADWPIRVVEYRILRLITSGAAGVAGIYLGSQLGLSAFIPRLIAFSLFGLIGYLLPRWYVGWRVDRRLQKIEDQLPETLTNMAKSLRTGLGMLQALGYATEQTVAPLGPELRRSLRDLELGADPERVFRELNRRTNSKDLEIATSAMLIQRSVGGNLSEVLSNVAGTIRERHEIKAEVLVLTARQKLTGNFVAIMPVGIAFAFYLINPETARLLIEDPTGRISLAIGICFELAGLWLIRRLAVIEV